MGVRKAVMLAVAVVAALLSKVRNLACEPWHLCLEPLTVLN